MNIFELCRLLDDFRTILDLRKTITPSNDTEKQTTPYNDNDEQHRK